MATFTRADLFERELRKLVEAKIEHFKEEISCGMLKTYDEYRFYAGQIAGCREMLDCIDDPSAAVDKTMS